MLNNLIKTALGASAVALATLAAPATAGAQPADVIVTATGEEVLRAEVSYAGLDLRNPQGVARLQRQVRAAVHQVCPMGDVRNLVEGRHGAACRSDAQQQASAQIDAAVARAQSGQFAASNSSIRITAR